MTSTLDPAIDVRYEGGGTGTELWGMTQANFVVSLPGRHDKEVAVFLNDAAAHLLAQELDQPDTSEFRQAAAHQAGQFWVEELVRGSRHLDSQIFVSVGLLDEHPEIIAHLKQTRAD